MEQGCREASIVGSFVVSCSLPGMLLLAGCQSRTRVATGEPGLGAVRRSRAVVGTLPLSAGARSGVAARAAPCLEWFGTSPWQSGHGGLTIPGRKGRTKTRRPAGSRSNARAGLGPAGRGKPAFPSEASRRFSHRRAAAGTGFPPEQRGRGAARGRAAGSGAPCRGWAGPGQAGPPRACRERPQGARASGPRGPLAFLLP